jgi:hypothetical protein
MTNNDVAKVVDGVAVLPHARRLAMIEAVQSVAGLEGDLAEMGVFRGGSAKLMASACPGKALHLFDTFAGLPGDGGNHHKGEFAASEAEVRKYLAGQNVQFHPGFFPATTAGLNHLRFACVHIDGDLYQSTADALDFFWPRMVEGGAMLLDDWDWPDTPGVTKAIKERFANAEIEVTASNQVRIKKTKRYPKMGTVFTHGGSIGDTLASLSAMAQVGEPIDYYLNRNAHRHWRQPVERLEALKALIEAQPWCNKCELSNGVVGKNLDEWRRNWRQGFNLADMHCAWLKLPHIDRNRPWLTVATPKPMAKVVIHRSPRYHNHRFPWCDVVDKYGHDILFVGGDYREHADFCQRFGQVSYHNCKDYLECAEIIKGSKLFIGNQSSPQWVAEGLKVPKILESASRDSWSWNCHWQRDNCQSCEDGNVNLPDL